MNLIFFHAIEQASQADNLALEPFLIMPAFYMPKMLFRAVEILYRWKTSISRKRVLAKASPQAARFPHAGILCVHLKGMFWQHSPSLG